MTIIIIAIVLIYLAAVSTNNRENVSSMARLHKTNAIPNSRNFVTLVRWKKGRTMLKYRSKFNKNNVMKEIAIKPLAVNSNKIKVVHLQCCIKVFTINATTLGLPKTPIIRSFEDNKAIKKYDFFLRNSFDFQQAKIVIVFKNIVDTVSRIFAMQIKTRFIKYDFDGNPTSLLNSVS
jgi:hypothetical protein